MPKTSYVKEFYKGPFCTGSGATTGSTSYVTLDHSPTLTFTPQSSGKFKVYSNVSVNISNTNFGNIRMFNSAGSAVLEAESAWTGTGAGSFYTTAPVVSIFQLVAGVSYSFDIQGSTVPSNVIGINVQSTDGSQTPGFYIFAERIG